MKAAVTPERVFVATCGLGWRRHARLVNEAGTVKWECPHNHRSHDVAVRCGERERARWIRGKRAA